MTLASSAVWAASDTPNIILVMADDLGYGDVGYAGNPTVQTPHLDAMASEGIRLNRFYAAAPVCSPTRASCLTGRHPYRMNMPWASDGSLPEEEHTIGEMLQQAGYATGHFGKWHVGSLSKTVKQSYFPGPVDPTTYAPPWDHGFDVCFSTESMMPTFNPYYHVGGDYGAEDYRNVQNVPVAIGQRTGGFRWRDSYWTGPGEIHDEWLEGDDSKIIMDRALDFIQRKSAQEQPFLSLIWFHTPHTPIVGGDKDRAAYNGMEMEAQHWYGCISAMDRQIGRLRAELRRLGIADDTLLWFCSDNGPSYIHDWNSSGGLRGKKGSLYEGGIRVPAIVEWPSRLTESKEVETPLTTSDILPTIQSALRLKQMERPYDGIDVLSILSGNQDKRGVPIGFQSPLRGARWEKQEGKESMALVADRFKLLSIDGGTSFQLYDLIQNPAETIDVGANYPEILTEMIADLRQWMESCSASSIGEDYR